MAASQQENTDRLARFERLAQANLGRPPELRDFLYLLDLQFDPDAQMGAILSLLSEHAEAAEGTRSEIYKRQDFAKKCCGLRKVVEEGAFFEMIEYSIYQDAAHSMAAVGMLAPLLESTFVHCFAAVQRGYYSDRFPDGGHARWQESEQQAWDCHYVYRAGRRWNDIVGGIMQLADAIGLKQYLPERTAMVLTALLAYRNKMFHCGFEWPENERDRFATHIVSEGWPDEWFKKTSSNGKPLMFYMSRDFVRMCQQTFDGVLDAFCELVKRLMQEGASPQSSQMHALR